MMMKKHRQHFLRQFHSQSSEISRILRVFGANLFHGGVRVLSDSLYSTNTQLSALSRMFSWECLSAGGNVRYPHPEQPRETNVWLWKMRMLASEEEKRADHLWQRFTMNYETIQSL